MVTKAAMVRVNTRIRRCGFKRPRMRLTMMLEQMSTKAVAAAMVTAGFMALVTASVGHIPRGVRELGFSGSTPLMNRSRAVGPDLSMLEVVLSLIGWAPPAPVARGGPELRAPGAGPCNW